ncbi:MAG: sel1 repeat family protein [Brucellaceae bacterium]|nr:sel1 repeat family protein [Brucellaceae bacterium]
MPVDGRFLAASLLAILIAGAAAASETKDDRTPAASAGSETPAPNKQLDPPFAQRQFDVDPTRFGLRPSDEAFGAFQRGLYLTAHNLAKPLAENGNAQAQVLLAEILARGLGVPRDDAGAAHWYREAALQGVPEAEFQYALLLLEGHFYEKDEMEAMRLMRKAADAGNRLAQFNVAQLLVQERPGPAGMREALPYFRKAAEAGVPDAQYALSQILSSGIANIIPDDEEALKWLTLAAQQNYDTAQVDLGTWLVEGRGGQRDAKAGFRWLKLAADQGNVAAQNRVAKLYRAGVGVEADPVEAAAWYILARRAGLVDHELDVFMEGLTDETKKKALERANRLR